MARFEKNRSYLYIGLIFIALIILHYLGWLSAVENRVRKLFSPFLSSAYGISVQIGDNYQFFATRSEFISAYEKSRIEAEQMNVIKADLKRLAEENTELKKQLHFIQKNSYGSVLANVVGKDLASTEQIILIDRGTADGIMANDPVISGGGILIGKIIRAEQNQAFVRLLNDNLSRVGATVQNQDKSLGVIEGGFGISLKMNLIPRDEVLLVGDPVITSGLEEKMPRGLLIGNITEIENEPYKPFQQAIITPATDLSKQAIVSILMIR